MCALHQLAMQFTIVVTSMVVMYFIKKLIITLCTVVAHCERDDSGDKMASIDMISYVAL